MKYKFLIYISHSYAIPIGNPLEKEIIKRGFDVFWFSEEDEGKKALDSKNNSLETIQDVIKYSPHILLAATDNAPDFVKALKIQIFHGQRKMIEYLAQHQLIGGAIAVVKLFVNICFLLFIEVLALNSLPLDFLMFMVLVRLQYL